MTTTIAFYIRNLSPDLRPFSSRELYFYSYQEYLLAMKQAGAQVYFVTGNDTYLGEGVFSESWTIDRVSEVKDFIPAGQIKADLVFDKGGFEGHDIKVVTDQRLHAVLSDKITMYEQFGHFQPTTTTCNNLTELAAAIESMHTEKVVVKNPHGDGGSQVYIGTKTGIKVPDDETFPLIVQEFVDMSGGIPGLAAGAHDLRLLLAGNKIIGATLREPAPGQLHANVSRGGTEKLVGAEDIPTEVVTMAHQIDKQLEDLPRYYSIDFALGKQGWRMIELNNKPGLFRESTGPLAKSFMQQLAQYLVHLS